MSLEADENVWGRLTFDGQIALGRDDLEAAAYFFTQAAQVAIATSGDGLPLAHSLVSLSGVLIQWGQFEQARPLLTAALKIRRANMARHNPLLAEVYHLLANMHHGLKNYAAAESYYKETLAALSYLPEWHPDKQTVAGNYLALVEEMEGLLRCG
jgi:tetratricopeptide (TPR) repeat protein